MRYQMGGRSTASNEYSVYITGTSGQNSRGGHAKVVVYGTAIFPSIQGVELMAKTKKSGEAKQSELPKTLKRSSAKAQRTFTKTYDAAIKEYNGDEERAYRTAYASLEKKYEKADGKWKRKKDDDAPSAKESKKSESKKADKKSDSKKSEAKKSEKKTDKKLDKKSDSKKSDKKADKKSDTKSDFKKSDKKKDKKSEKKSDKKVEFKVAGLKHTTVPEEIQSAEKPKKTKADQEKTKDSKKKSEKKKDKKSDSKKSDKKSEKKADSKKKSKESSKAPKKAKNEKPQIVKDEDSSMPVEDYLLGDPELNGGSSKKSEIDDFIEEDLPDENLYASADADVEPEPALDTLHEVEDLQDSAYPEEELSEEAEQLIEELSEQEEHQNLEESQTQAFEVPGSTASFTLESTTKRELYAEAVERGIAGRSTMNKEELFFAVKAARA